MACIWYNIIQNQACRSRRFVLQFVMIRLHLSSIPKLLLLLTRRHIISSLLLGLFLILQLLPIAVHIALRTHQSMMQENNNTNQLSTLHFSKIQWEQVVKHTNNEIDVHGRLFDIKSVVVSENQVIVKGFYDTVDDALVAVSKDIKKKNQHLEKHHPVFTPLFCEDPQQYSFFRPANKSAAFIDVAQDIFTSFFQEDSPPPKV